MIYYISDMHLGHENVLRFDKRPFENVDEMGEAIIRNWNERIADKDTVIVIGDAFWKNEPSSIKLFKRLNGMKHLIKGNHDRAHGQLGSLWKSIRDYAEINDNGRLVVVSHYPMMFYKGQHNKAIMLYGHVHNSAEWEIIEKWQQELREKNIPSRMINVGCMMEYMRYTPRTLDELLTANPGQDCSSETEQSEDVTNTVAVISYRKLWHKMIDLGINGIDLCQKTGVSNATLSKMKRGGKVTKTTLMKISAALDCDVEDIMEYTIATLDAQ